MSFISEYIAKFESQFNLFGALGIGGALLGILIALVYCFFGYKLVKVFVTLCGGVLGAGLFLALCKLLKFNQTWTYAALLLGFIVGAVLVFFLFKAGLAIMVTISAFGIFVGVTDRFLEGHAVWIAALFLAIAVGVATIWFAKPVVIIVSAVSGGVGASAILFHKALSQVMSLNPQNVLTIVILVVGVVLAAFGMYVQFRAK